MGQPSTHASPISYSRDVDRILAIRCSGCHGPDEWWGDGNQGGLDVSSYSTFMSGGGGGIPVDIRDVENSLILKYLESNTPNLGSRYVRMPFVDEPLLPDQIDTIRSWIRAGATDDHAYIPKHRIRLPDVHVTNPRDPLEDIICRIPVEAFARIVIRDIRDGSILARRGAGIYASGGDNDAPLGGGASPGGWLFWSLNSSRDNHAPRISWPNRIIVDLEIWHNKSPLNGAEFGIRRTTDSEAPLLPSTYEPKLISAAATPTVTFTYRLDSDADVDIEIYDQFDTREIFSDHKSDLRADPKKQYPWSLRDTQGTRVKPGVYHVRFRAKTRAGVQLSDVCLLIAVSK